MLAQVRDHDFVRLIPPLEESLAGSLQARFGYPSERMRVVQLDGEAGAEMVTAVAADLVMDKAARPGGEELSRPIGLGLGPGRATLAFCRHLSSRLKSQTDLPRKCLRLHAITAGGSTMYPENAPVSFFNLFAKEWIAQSVGFFAETLVTAKRFREMKSRPTAAKGVRGASPDRYRGDFTRRLPARS